MIGASLLHLKVAITVLQVAAAKEEDEATEMEALRTGGFLEGQTTRPKLEARPGDRRLRRVIRYAPPEGEGEPLERTIIYTGAADKDKARGLQDLLPLSFFPVQSRYFRSKVLSMLSVQHDDHQPHCKECMQTDRHGCRLAGPLCTQAMEYAQMA